MDPRLLALIVFVVIEAAILLARRFAAPLRPGFAFQVWAVVLACYLGLHSLELVATEPAWWRILGTLLLMLSVMVVYEVVGAFVLQRPARHRSGPQLPKLLRDVIRVVLVVISGIVAASYIYEIPLPTVLVSSTVLSAVLGLALQDVLKNVFAGIAVQLEGEVRVGDWLLLDGHAAMLRDVSWRTTHFRTNEGVRILEPNAQFAARRLIHYRAGDPPVAFSFAVGLPYEAPPAVAKEALLAAAASAAGALKDPPPVAMTRSFGDSAIEYELRVWTHDVHRIGRFRDRVNSRIWYEIQRAGLYIPFPIRSVHLSDEDEKAAANERLEDLRAAALLQRVELFSQLRPEARAELAGGARRLHFEDGEVLVAAGEQGDSAFVVDRGQVAVSGAGREGADGEAVAAEGMLFGEMTLLLGEPRRETVTTRGKVEAVFLSREEIQPILAQNPALAEELSQALARQLAATVRSDGLSAERRQQSRREQGTILRRIRGLFRLG